MRRVGEVADRSHQALSLRETPGAVVGEVRRPPPCSRSPSPPGRCIVERGAAALRPRAQILEGELLVQRRMPDDILGSSCAIGCSYCGSLIMEWGRISPGWR